MSTTLSAEPAAVPASRPKVYFKNLDGIRFFAAFMVLIQHMSDYKANAGSGANYELEFVSSLGAYGVTLFFVLSGYLIFYLLFAERQYTGTIRIRDFYVRRMLRIWPLYFGFGLVLIIGIDTVFRFIGSPITTPVLENLAWLFTFSVNLQLIFAAANKGIIELYWSVCIEEQFYLIAPWFVKKWGHRMLTVIISLIAVGFASRLILGWLIHEKLVNFSGHVNPVHFFTTSWFDSFGMGILAAWLYFDKARYRHIQRYVENYYIQGAVLLFTLLYAINLIPLPDFVESYMLSTIPSIMFAYIVLSASTGNFILNLESPLFRMLGRVSYGMYIFHAIIAQAILYLFLKVFAKGSILYYEVLYPIVCLVAVVLVSWISYEVYEKRFLKMKKKFTVVQNQKYS